MDVSRACKRKAKTRRIAHIAERKPFLCIVFTGAGFLPHTSIVFFPLFFFKDGILPEQYTC